MHSKYQRRIQHAGRVPIWKRQGVPDNATDNQETATDSGFVLTAPITLTVIETLSSSSSSTSTSSSAISTSSSAEQSSLSTSSSIASASGASQTPSETSSSSSTPLPSVILPTITPSGTSSGNSTQLGSSALSSTKLPGGSIAGIVIGCLIVLAAIVFFLFRARAKRNRRKLRSLWTESKAVKGPVGFSAASYEPKSYGGSSASANISPRMQFLAGPQQPQLKLFNGNLAIQIPGSNISAPPNSYNNGEVSPPYSTSPSGSTPVAVYSPGSTSMSPFSATVVCTFITSLPDELSIKVGETIRVLAEYDDGWSLCMNVNGEQGMVPLECLNRGQTNSTIGGLAASTLDRDARGSRRVSSLDPTAPALKVYRS